jgi:RNA polymerase sigma factor (sigma-70 family)
MSPSSQSLSDAISGLPEEERIILTMHYLRSMSTGEIAQILGVPERAVSAIVEQGKARLLMIMGM